MTRAMNAPKTLRRRVSKALRGPHVPGVGCPKDKGLRARLRHALDDQRGWWDWGHPLMCLVGRDDVGSYSAPEPRSWYWYDGPNGPVIAKSYAEKRAVDAQVELERELWAARWPEERRQAVRDESWELHRGQGPLAQELHADRCPEDPYWHYFNVQDDGRTLIPGNIYEGNCSTNFGLGPAWSKVLVRYVVVEWWLKANWLGLRPWLYYKGLHAAVNDRKPFTCQVTPEPGSGGYSHWHCQLKKRHAGSHRYRAYTWSGAGTRVEHQPVEQ